jgi:hypothetical protein
MKKKNVLTAILLPFFFEALGMLYAAPIGTAILLGVAVIILLFRIILGAMGGSWENVIMLEIIVVRPFCMLWAGIAAIERNKLVEDGVKNNVNTNFDVNNELSCGGKAFGYWLISLTLSFAIYAFLNQTNIRSLPYPEVSLLVFFFCFLFIIVEYKDYKRPMNEVLKDI